MKLLSCLSQKDERPIRPEEEENKMKFEIVIGCIIVFSMAVTLISWANDWGKQL